MDVIKNYQKVSVDVEKRKWPLVGNYIEGATIPFFGQLLHYNLRTGNGIEDYTSILRYFGWVMVMGLTEDDLFITVVQWKPGTNCASWELPPGGIGRVTPGMSQDDILGTTRKIYEATTGYGEGQWEYIGHGMVETGKYRGASAHEHGFPVHLYLATGLRKKFEYQQPPNTNEIYDLFVFPKDHIRRVMESGLFKELSGLACAYPALIKLGLLEWTI